MAARRVEDWESQGMAPDAQQRRATRRILFVSGQHDWHSGGQRGDARAEDVLFFGMFELPKTFSHEGFMANLFASGLGEKCVSLPILRPEVPKFFGALRGYSGLFGII